MSLQDVGQDARDDDGVRGAWLLGLTVRVSPCWTTFATRTGLDVGQELGVADVRAGRRRLDPREQQRRGADDEHQHHDAVPEELGIQKEPPDRTGDDRAPQVGASIAASVVRAPLTEVMALDRPYGRGRAPDGGGGPGEESEMAED